VFSDGELEASGCLCVGVVQYLVFSPWFGWVT
jgi:hypothetical protein